jgi:hypothetical protein
VLNIFNDEWGQEHQRRCRHHMLQTEMMHRQQQQQQQQQPVGSGSIKILMGGSIVNPDPSVEQAAAAAAAAEAVAAHRLFVTRHHGQDIICSGSSVAGEVERKSFHQPCVLSPPLRQFSLDELRAKYKRASETAWR